MKRINSNFVNILYILCCLISLIVVRFYFGSEFVETEVFLFICFLLFTLSILVIVPKKWNLIPGILITSSYTIYIITQIIYFRGFTFYYRLSTAFSLKKELSLSLNSALELVKVSDVLMILFVVLLQIFFAYFLLASKRRKGMYFVNLIIGAATLIGGIFFFVLYQNNLQKPEDIDPFLVYKTNYYIYDSIPSTLQFVNLYGPTTLLYRDMQTVLNHTSSQSHIEEIEDYLANKHESGKNEYTGLLNGKSLFIVQAESLANAFINPKLTPTLYRLKNEGLFFENFDAPLLPGSTSDSEFMCNIGLIPESEGYASSFRFAENEFPTTLAKVFNNEGYQSYAFHNNFGEFYNRSKFFPNIGYDFLDSYTLGIETESADSVAMEAFKYILLEEPKFLAFWITYSGHQPYGTPDYDKNISQYKDEAIKAFPTLNMEYITILCKTMDLDRALGEFIKKAEDAHRMEDIVILIYGDHAIKGNYLQKENLDNVKTLVGNANITEADLFYYAANPLIIYNSALSKGVNSTVSSTIDISPTIYNLFGLDYDHKTLIGNDILDPTYNGMYFNNFGYFATNDFTYDTISDIYKSKNGYQLINAKDDIAEINRTREISKYILDVDYYSQK